MNRRRFLRIAGAAPMAFAAPFSIAVPPADRSENLKRLLEWIRRAFAAAPIELLSNLPSGRTYGGTDRPDLQRLYWLQNCNLYAQHALKAFDAELAERIRSSYWRWHKEHFAHCEERTENYLPVGQLPAHPAPPGKYWRVVVERKEFDGFTIGTETQKPGLFGDIREDDPRGLLKFGVLGAALRGEKDEAQRRLKQALALWNGSGFAHTRMDRHRSYYARYLAYALIAERAAGLAIPPDIRAAIEGRLWALQDADGGLWTNYDADGAFPDMAKKTTEIAPLTLLAYNDEIWPR
ncbi:MAG: hypothetical protein BWZ10_01368 [candidate division BRC1 bacterium ADurb.BinA364]|nr:MAG: hypothetical protein BWZ10_01368 [candidate division BRC1 bacterium ADurb.BinA364]